MFAAITFPTALVFWLKYENMVELKSVGFEQANFEFRTDLRNPYLEFAERYGIKSAFHIMVSDKTTRSHGKLFKCHLIPQGIPMNSFVRLSDSLWIIRPELCFLLAANYLTVQELAVLGCDLCAMYAGDPFSEYDQFSRLPVTSVEKLKDYLDNVQHVNGIKKARVALQFVLNNSNSPKESKIAVTAILKHYYGGYGLKKPLLNEEFDFSEMEGNLLYSDKCYGDLVWLKERLVLEYDSDLAHSSGSQMRKDKNKGFMLNRLGFRVINVTKDHFANYNTVENLFVMVQKMLGMHTNANSFQKFYPQRKDLIRKFFLTTDSLNWIDWAEKLAAE